MENNSANSNPAGACNSVYLDYGVDSTDLDDDDFSLSDRGLIFASRWQFSVGTQLVVKLNAGSSRCTSLQQAEGIVVECDRVDRGRHRTTVLFLEISPGLRSVLRTRSRENAAQF